MITTLPSNLQKGSIFKVYMFNMNFLEEPYVEHEICIVLSVETENEVSWYNCFEVNHSRIDYWEIKNHNPYYMFEILN